MRTLSATFRQMDLPLDIGKLRVPITPTYDSAIYHSWAEARISRYLERHVSGWKPRIGHTVQVDIGNGKAVDFRVRDALVEFHPIVICRELRSLGAAMKFHAVFAKLDKEGKADLKEALEIELFAQYMKKRKLSQEACPNKEVRSLKLIFCQNEIEFYNRVLVPYSNRGLLPRAHEFIQDWRK